MSKRTVQAMLNRLGMMCNEMRDMSENLTLHEFHKQATEAESIADMIGEIGDSLLAELRRMEFEE